MRAWIRAIENRILRTPPPLSVVTAAIAFVFATVPLLITANVAGASAITPRITDVRDTAFVVSWSTASSSTGSVKYAPAVNGSCSDVTLTMTASDKRGPSISSTLHYVQVSGLVPGTYPAYCIQAVSGSDTSDVTLVTLGATFKSPSAPEQVYGSVTLSGQTVSEAIIYATASDASGASSVISGLVDVGDEGYWLLDIGSFRTSTLGATYVYTDATAVLFDTVGADGRTLNGLPTTIAAIRSGSLILAMEIPPPQADYRSEFNEYSFCN
jgi:hypothetical protein